MTLRQVWILNYGTTVTLLTLMSGTILKTVDLQTSDKDIIAIYAVILVGLYLGLLTYLFYKTIYKWGTNSRLSFYLISLLTVILSIIILTQNLGAKDVNYSLLIVSTLLLCGANVLTYCLGLLTKIE